MKKTYNISVGLKHKYNLLFKSAVTYYNIPEHEVKITGDGYLIIPLEFFGASSFILHKDNVQAALVKIQALGYHHLIPFYRFYYGLRLGYINQHHFGDINLASKKIKALQGEIRL